MSIEHAILGLLSWRPLTGYDLKKLFADSPALPWSGNNNQVYRTLVDLHRRGLVAVEVELQERGPARKVYTLTAGGQAELGRWLRSAPVLPELRHPFLVQLAWAAALPPEELDGLLARYEEELDMQLRMLRHRPAGPRRDGYLDPEQARTPRETLLWARIGERWAAFYEEELGWVRRLREEVKAI